jgi:hypothetical protein
MTTLQTILGFDTSEPAKFRFHVLTVFYAGGWRSAKLAFPKLSKPTLYRWKKAYERSGKRLNSLLPVSTKPHHRRVSTIPLPIISLIRNLRETYPRMGKSKIKLFVDPFCSKEGLETISEASIGRVIKRFNLFFAGLGNGRRVRKELVKRARIKLCPAPAATNPGYLQLDGFKFYYLGKYYYFLTAVEISGKQAWVKLVPALNSLYSREFLKGICLTSYYQIHTIQTDNGSEFKKYFEKAAKEAGLTHLFTYPKHPKTNGFVERLNWTVQDEFLFNKEDLLLYPEDFHKELESWLEYYNKIRPHQSLDYLTPYQYYLKGGLSQKY